MEYDKFLLFGDSITQFSTNQDVGFGLQPALQYEYVRKLDVINRGYSGYNSEHARLIFPEILKSSIGKNIRLMTIFFGTNDALDNTNDIQPVELERYRDNIDTIVRLAKEHNISVVVIGPSLHDPKIVKAVSAQNGKDIEGNITTNKRLLMYSETAKQVAESNGVAFVDLWHAFQKELGLTDQQLFDISVDTEYPSLASLLNDGIHFTDRAYRILFELVKKAISDTYTELTPDNLPMVLADWDEINPKDLSSIFNN